MNLIVSGLVDEELAARLAGLVRAAAIRSAPRVVHFDGAADAPSVREAVLTACEAARADCAFIEGAPRLDDFGVLAMDMDSTLITIECIDELADYAGRKPEVAAITEAAMRGEIKDFAESLRRRVALLEGLPIDALQATLVERLRLSDGAERMLAAAHAAGVRTLLVSGGFTFFAEAVQTRLGITRAIANRLDDHEGRLTGRLRGPILDGAGKAEALRAFAEEHRVPLDRAIAIGDGANDIPMLSEAGLAIAYHAKPLVCGAADQSIRFGGLDVLLDWLAPPCEPGSGTAIA